MNTYTYTHLPTSAAISPILLAQAQSFDLMWLRFLIWVLQQSSDSKVEARQTLDNLGRKRAVELTIPQLVTTAS